MSEFHHEIRTWTVGDLRAALDGLPDTTPVRVFYAEEPGGSTADEQVVVAAGPDRHVWDPDGRVWREVTPAEAPWFSLEADFPTGIYERSER